ncbi:MAG: hypothetical protein M1822_009441 [Bathelium mastoideum]|nr:MAG: hypothetical protein M1822_009441 [Bathelium mastoideum]
MARSIAFKAMIEGKKPFITVVDPRPLSATFLAGSIIRKAVFDRNLADPKTRLYRGRTEYLHWGTIRASEHNQTVFLATVPFSELLAVAENHANVHSILRLNLLKTGRSGWKVSKAVAKDPIRCDESIASGLALIAKVFNFNPVSRKDHLQDFLLGLAFSFGIQPAPSKLRGPVGESFVRTFTQSDELVDLFSPAISKGYDRFTAWIRKLPDHSAVAAGMMESKVCTKKISREEQPYRHRKGKEDQSIPQALRDKEVFATKIPFEEQPYRGRKGEEDESIPWVTRSMSNASKKRGRRSHRSRSASQSRAPYHEERMIKTTLIGIGSQKRKNEECIDERARSKQRTV